MPVSVVLSHEGVESTRIGQSAGQIFARASSEVGILCMQAFSGTYLKIHEK